MQAGDTVIQESAFPGGLGAIDDGRWRAYRLSAGAADQQDMEYLPWADFSLCYDRQPVSACRPAVFTRRPDGVIQFSAPADDQYAVLCEFYRRPQPLAVNTDTPLAPEEYHMAIVWHAVSAYAQSEEAGVLYATAQRAYQAAIAKMRLTQLPEMVWGAPLA